MLKRFLVIVGPTGCGKTAVVDQLSRKLPIEAVSCDSMQVYRGMPVITQAPPASGRGVPRTHLVSFVPVTGEYSAARFREDAGKLLEAIWKRKRTPVVVGGTGLYLRSLLDGLFETSPGERDSDEAYRRGLYEEAARDGAPALHRRLSQVDPLAAAKIHPNDARRIVRALEVHHLTGKPISARQPTRRGIRQEYPHRIFLIDREREDLYRRIDRRVERMFEDGLIAEARRVLKRRPGKTAAMALGLREAAAVIGGTLSEKQARDSIQMNTRRYAKRQMSWFRHEKGVEPVAVAPGETPERTARRILKLWKETL